jgi:hypothetical protein
LAITFSVPESTLLCGRISVPYMPILAVIQPLGLGARNFYCRSQVFHFLRQLNGTIAKVLPAYAITITFFLLLASYADCAAQFDVGEILEQENGGHNPPKLTQGKVQLVLAAVHGQPYR